MTEFTSLNLFIYAIPFIIIGIICFIACTIYANSISGDKKKEQEDTKDKLNRK